VAHGAEISDELGHAPASNIRRRGPYHGKLVRARAARGRGGARGKMEASMVRCGGRNGNAGELARSVTVQVRLWARERQRGGKHEWRGRCCGRLEGGRARAREGAIGRHPAGVTGMRPPRGARRLPWSGQWGARAGEGGRVGPGRGRAWASVRCDTRVGELGWAGLREQAEAEAVAH
jgi:hypothetical protein